MSELLPRLRRVLDVIPSVEPERPGLYLRDPFRYSEAILYVPPLWVMALSCLDGAHTGLDLHEMLARATGRIDLGSEAQKFVGLLRSEGFLETEEFERLRERCHHDFREAPQRQPIHAGTAYPLVPGQLGDTFNEYFQTWIARAGPAQDDGLPSGALGIAAPHVSPEGGRHGYAAAYRPLAAHPELAGRTFVVLGTSHYGQPQRFGLTRKPFVTPLGTMPVDTELVDELERRAGDAITPEDYCHSIEHSIEFQCVFLQHVLGSGVKILPVLCGPFSASLESGAAPESDEGVAHFIGALGEIGEKHAGRLFWVLGIDMAHMGRRYGDPFEAETDRDAMATVAELDRRRLDSVCAGDGAGFFEQVKQNGDELKWCGYSPLYTFLKAVPRARGRVLHYEQWNIDPQSVVSFAALDFF